MTAFLLILVFTSCHSQSADDLNQDQEKDDSINSIGAGLTTQFPGDEGLNNHRAVLFASGFENGFDGWTKYNPNVSVIVENESISNSGSKSLQTTAKKNGGDVIF